MQFLHTHAFAIMMSSVLLFFLSLLVVGTPQTRDVLDIASMVAGYIFGSLYLVPAVYRLRQGAALAEWRMMIGMVVLAYGWGLFRTWGLFYRAYDRPVWMMESPINAALVGLVLAGFLLKISGSVEAIPRLPATRIYYVAAGVLAGILIGLGIQQVWRVFG